MVSDQYSIKYNLDILFYCLFANITGIYKVIINCLHIDIINNAIVRLSFYISYIDKNSNKNYLSSISTLIFSGTIIFGTMMMSILSGVSLLCILSKYIPVGRLITCSKSHR